MQQTSADRIRMTMYPDTIKEGEEVPSTQVITYIHTYVCLFTMHTCYVCIIYVQCKRMIQYVLMSI